MYMKLIEILKEALRNVGANTFPLGEVPPMIKLVFYDEKYGLKDSKTFSGVKILKSRLL